jgi:hypothetical protein
MNKVFCKKGQSSFEFVMLMTFVMLMFAITFVVIQDKGFFIRSAQTENQARAVSNLINTEVELAYKVYEGYEKEFWIPEYINGEDYSIEFIEGAELKISYKDNVFLSFLSLNRTNVSGTIEKGYNIIKKNSSGIFISPGRI